MITILLHKQNSKTDFDISPISSLSCLPNLFSLLSMVVTIFLFCFLFIKDFYLFLLLILPLNKAIWNGYANTVDNILSNLPESDNFENIILCCDPFICYQNTHIYQKLSELNAFQTLDCIRLWRTTLSTNAVMPSLENSFWKTNY